MTERKPRKKRTNREGTVYWSESRQRWVAAYIFNPGTPQQRKATRLRTNERDAIRELAALRRQAEDGRPPEDHRLKLSEWLDYWIKLVEASNRKLSTKVNYADTVTLHVKPALGHIRLSQLQAKEVHDFPD